MKTFSTLFENIAKIRFGPVPDFDHVRVQRLYYIQNGRKKKRDILVTHKNMNILIFNTEKQKLIMLHQFRPSVYYNIVKTKIKKNEYIDLKKYPPSIGNTIELCCCFAEEGIPYAATIKQTIWKKCSYKIMPDKLEEIITYSSGVGFSSARQKLYYCEVSEKDKFVNPDKDNKVTVIEYSLAEVEDLFKTNQVVNATAAVLFGILWTLRYRLPNNSYYIKNK